MNRSSLALAICVCALGCGVAGGEANAQQQGMLSNYSADISAPKSGCPGIQWHISRTGDLLTGYMWYDDDSGLSSSKGEVAKGSSVQMTVTSVKGNGPQGTVDGQFERDGSFVADLKGEGCSNLHVVFRPEQNKTRR